MPMILACRNVWFVVPEQVRKTSGQRVKQWWLRVRRLGFKCKEQTAYLIVAALQVHSCGMAFAKNASRDPSVRVPVNCCCSLDSSLAQRSLAWFTVATGRQFAARVESLASALMVGTPPPLLAVRASLAYMRGTAFALHVVEVTMRW